MEVPSPAYEHDSPARSLECSIGEIVLTHYNCVIRLFDAPYDDRNHLEYEHSDGRSYGIRLSQEHMDELFELSYPMLTMPYVDEGTERWFISLNEDKMEEEIRDILNG